jgi:peptidyl-prolyl cis-trans isomerase A (cyclophilin A)
MSNSIYAFLIILILLNDSFGQPAKKKEIIIIRTEFGDIYARLDLKNAPISSINFLRYVDSNMFESTCFYRVVRLDNQPHDSIRIEVIQGGRYKNEDNGFAPIAHETTKITGIMHKDGTMSMARNGPGSATSEFFICVGDQPELDFGGKRNPDGQGFAAFGKVVKGMDVVKKIHSVNSEGQYLQKPVIILGITRVRNQKQ